LQVAGNERGQTRTYSCSHKEEDRHRKSAASVGHKATRFVASVLHATPRFARGYAA
jgi:hypothetical protein